MRSSKNIHSYSNIKVIVLTPFLSLSVCSIQIFYHCSVDVLHMSKSHNKFRLENAIPTFMQNPLMSSLFPTKSPQLSCRFVYRLFQEILLLTSYSSELQIMNLIKLQLSRKFFFTYNAVPLFVSFLTHGLEHTINLHSCVLFSLSLCEDSYEYLN